jgi:TonB family protein
MILYALRLLVALLTFAVGVAAAWLFDFKSPAVFEVREVTTTSILVTSDRPLDKPQPPASCASKQPVYVQGGLLNFKAVRKPFPLYPPAAKAARVGGTVVVQVEVDENGGVAKAEAVSGPSMLHEAAVDAAREAQFSPTRLSGQPVRVTGLVTYNFVLK